MGQSLPPPATLDLVGSYARRNGSAIDLLLARSDLPNSTGPLVVELSKGASSVTGTAEVRASGEGSDVQASVPARQLSDGVWKIQLGVAGDDERVPVSARLLVQGQRPVVLLWGEKTQKSMVPAAKTVTGGVARRVAAGGSKALDVGLKALPEQQAAKVRQTVKKVAKAVLR
jgi:hypothetical protein